MLIDTHTHIVDERTRAVADEVVDGFKDNGISAVVECGYDVNSSKLAVELAGKYKSVFCAVGLHPHESERAVESDLVQIEMLAKSSRVVAIGEIGLDYFYEHDRKLQKKLFVNQLVIADKLKLPVIIHLRDAYQDMEDILIENQNYLNSGILFHCYCGSAEMVGRFKRFDPYYAFGGAITFKNNNRADAIKAIAKDRLLIETDCPYMTPAPYRGKLNSPYYVKFVAQKMADDLGTTFEEVADLTSKNAIRFFGLEIE